MVISTEVMTRKDGSSLGYIIGCGENSCWKTDHNGKLYVGCHKYTKIGKVEYCSEVDDIYGKQDVRKL